jgi:hemerythrin-like domain-containing protein
MDACPDLSTYYSLHRQQRVDLHRFAVAVRTATESDRRGRLRPLARWARGFAGELDIHHKVEDDIFFPALRERVPSADAVLARLDDDHRDLEPRIERLASGAADLANPHVPFAPIHEEMTAVASDLHAFLTRHLDVEDEDLLPLFYRHFNAAEYDALHERAQRLTPKSSLAFAVPWFVAALDDEGRERVRAAAPRSMRLLYRLTRRSHARLVDRAFGSIQPASDNQARSKS